MSRLSHRNDFNGLETPWQEWRDSNPQPPVLEFVFAHPEPYFVVPLSPEIRAGIEWQHRLSSCPFLFCATELGSSWVANCYSTNSHNRHHSRRGRGGSKSGCRFPPSKSRWRS